MKYAEIAEALCREWKKRTGLKAICCLKKAWIDSKGRQWWTAFIKLDGISLCSISDPDPNLAWKGSLNYYCKSSSLSSLNFPVKANSIEELILKLVMCGEFSRSF